MPQTWFADAEPRATAFSVSHVCNNLSKHEDTMAYAHMDDVVVVDATQSPYAAHKLPIVEKSLVHQVQICVLQGTAFIVAATDLGAQIYDAKGDKRVFELALKEHVGSVDEGTAVFCRGIAAIDSNRPAIAVGSAVGKIFVLAKEKASKATADHDFDVVEKLGEHKEAIQSMACSAKGGLLASCDDSGTILVRNPEDAFEVVHRIPGDNYPATSLRFTPDGALVGGYLSGLLRVFRGTDFHVHAEIAAHSRAVTAIDVSDDLVVSVGEDTFVNVWELSGKKEAPRIKLVSSHSVPNDLLTGVAFVGAKSIITAAYDTTHLKLWLPE
ncbi:hypothetical protein P43SY_007694 [Pythium insidiosum]|uniref:WD repeat-containing protein 54 beta-propeller domain-containing protein n=1 Tax=Pythium insidiosum TaxID=114742 RepID=A0AAD5LG35_PYTIN|nr:hypothetical protein P43SY_007694 [Pythium insidiosum]